MFARRKNPIVSDRLSNRRAREDAAGKLADRCPDLESLSIDVHEAREGGWLTDTKYTLRIPVAGASALFEVSCSDRGCREGGYDVTHEVMRALLSRSERFEGETPCHGRCGNGECARVLHYVGRATYRTPGT